ncbi:hypothetical protein U1Q18_012546, partial [Sarracenia purpurea var. burkii]
WRPPLVGSSSCLQRARTQCEPSMNGSLKGEPLAIQITGQSCAALLVRSHFRRVCNAAIPWVGEWKPKGRRETDQSIS